jgi:hypothetical protein
MKIRVFVATGLALFALTFIVTHGVGCGITPKQAGVGTDAACKLVEALAQDATVESICADAPAIAELTASVLASRADAGADAGPRAAMACKVIPTTAVCATNAETLAGIRAVKARRK